MVWRARVVFAVRDAGFTFVDRFPGALDALDVLDVLDVFDGGFFLDGPHVDMTRPPYQPGVMGCRDPDKNISSSPPCAGEPTPPTVNRAAASASERDDFDDRARRRHDDVEHTALG